MTEDNIATRLAHLLEVERTALLEGDFEKVAELIEQKQKIISELRECPVAVGTLSPLRASLRRNQELFDHALAGIRNVAARLGDLNRARKSISTYDATGRKKSIAAPQAHKLEKRA